MYDVSKIEKINVDLLKLKPIKALKEVYSFYKKNLEKYFDNNGNPKKDYFNEIICPICKCSQYKHKITVDYFRYVECAKCNSVYNNPRLKDDIIEKMYKSGEYMTYFNKLTVTSQDFRKNVIEVRKFRQITSILNIKKGRILDVGCGSGSLLKVFQENGWEVYGVDPSDSATKIAKEFYDLIIFQGFFEDFKSEKKFDCITFWGIEHLSDPFKGMEKAIDLLDKNGIIVFEGPSADSFLMKYLCKNNFSPYRYIENARHVLFFSRNSINFLCEELNLEVCYFETIGLDLQTILPHRFNSYVMKKIMAMQQIINDLMLGDHYRVFLKKNFRNR